MVMQVNLQRGKALEKEKMMFRSKSRWDRISAEEVLHVIAPFVWGLSGKKEEVPLLPKLMITAILK